MLFIKLKRYSVNFTSPCFIPRQNLPTLTFLHIIISINSCSGYQECILCALLIKTETGLTIWLVMHQNMCPEKIIIPIDLLLLMVPITSMDR